MRYRGLLVAVLAACLAALAPAGAAGAPGATLTVPAQVQASPGASPVLQASFSYPESTPFCTVGVVFTWDGANWLSEFPNKSGSLCVVGGISAAAPAGRAGAGAHQVCASAGSQYSACKTVTVVVAPGRATPTPAPGRATTAPAPGAGAVAAPSAAPALALPTSTPGVRAPVAIVGGLSRQSATGLVLLAVGTAGLVVILGRRLLLRLRRHRRPALPSPGPGR